MAVWRNTTYDPDAILRSPTESVAGDGSRTMRKIYVAGAARQQAQIDFIGYPCLTALVEGSVQSIINTTNPFNGLPVSWLSRVTPHYYQPSAQVIRGNSANIGSSSPAFGPSPNQPVAIAPFRYCRSSPSSATRTLPQNNQPWIDAASIATGLKEEMALEYRSLDWRVCEDTDASVKGGVYTEAGGEVGNPFYGLPDEATGARYISRYYQDAGRFFIPGKNFMYYVGNGANADPRQPSSQIYFNFDLPQVIPEGQAIYEPRLRLVYVQHEVPVEAVPFVALESYEGSVNKYPFDPFRYRNTGVPGINNNGGGFWQGTVLYTSHDLKEGKSSDGQIVFDIYTRFTFQPNTDFGSVIPGVTCGTAYPMGPIPRGPNWRLRLLTVPFINGTPMSPQYNPALAVGAVVNFDYRPIYGASFTGTPPTQKILYGQPPYFVRDLNALFRPPLNGKPQAF